MDGHCGLPVHTVQKYLTCRAPIIRHGIPAEMGGTASQLIHVGGSRLHLDTSEQLFLRTLAQRTSTRCRFERGFTPSTKHHRWYLTWQSSLLKIAGDCGLALGCKACFHRCAAPLLQALGFFGCRLLDRFGHSSISRIGRDAIFITHIQTLNPARECLVTH